MQFGPCPDVYLDLNPQGRLMLEEVLCSYSKCRVGAPQHTSATPCQGERQTPVPAQFSRRRQPHARGPQAACTCDPSGIKAAVAGAPRPDPSLERLTALRRAGQGREAQGEVEIGRAHV